MATSQPSIGKYAPGTHPDLPPPAASVGAIGWLRTRLFSSVGNSLLTIIALLFIYWAVKSFLEFAVFDAVWDAKNKDDCRKSIGGACWGFVAARLEQFIYYQYPEALRWRIDLIGILLVGLGIPLLIPSFPKRNWIGMVMVFAFPAVAIWLLAGGFSILPLLPLVLGLLAVSLGTDRIRMLGLYALAGFATVVILSLIGDVLTTAPAEKAADGKPATEPFGLWSSNPLSFYWSDWGVGFLSLEAVETTKWGGFMLTMVIASTGIAASLPLGIVLALGRRSNMPVVKTICIVFIEFWRGVPLITVLYMAATMFPFFLPEGVRVNQLILALVGYSLFASAYMAEVVRGGLQALPKGQYEAADALGLNYPQSMRLIVLPQALKIVIPGIVNTFIGLFKDTTLVSIIALFDFLGIVQAGLTDKNWLAPNVPYTGYLFVAMIFLICCYGMSRYSRSVERRLDTGHKR